MRFARSRTSRHPQAAARIQEAYLMIRRSILPQARPALLLVMLSMAPALMAFAQDAAAQDVATQERLDRIERDLSMLQRQVYRDSGDTAPAGVAGTSTAVNLQVRMDRLEQQMRDLTGRVENMTNEAEQLRQRLEQVNSDIDVRLGQGQARLSGSAEPPPPRHPPGSHEVAAGESAPVTDAAAMPYGRPPPPSALPPPDQSASFGTLTPPGAGGPARDRPYPRPTGLTPQIASAASGGTLRPPGEGTLPAASTSAQYNAAFGLLRRADYPAAEDALRSFIQQHPKDPLAGNAQYWLGESFFARGRYSEAAAAFAEGYQRYPKGPKAPDGLLKLGMSLEHANQKHNACIALMQLDRAFPHSSSAIKDRAAQEKKRLGC
jgi:tol-pal system protein YbgF